MKVHLTLMIAIAIAGTMDLLDRQEGLHIIMSMITITDLADTIMQRIKGREREGPEVQTHMRRCQGARREAQSKDAARMNTVVQWRFVGL
jgi:hypothetical protein